MKTTARTMMMAATLMGTATFAHAAAKANEDGSQLAVWIFLGMCALIVVVQLFPLCFMAFGLLKGLAKGKTESTETPVEVVIDK